MKVSKVFLFSVSAFLCFSALTARADDGVVTEDHQQIKQDKAKGDQPQLKKDTDPLREARRAKQIEKDRVKKDKEKAKSDESHS